MLIIIILLLILMFAGLPSWPWGERLGYGWGPSGMLGIILLLLVVYMLLGPRHTYF